MRGEEVYRLYTVMLKFSILNSLLRSQAINNNDHTNNAVYYDILIEREKIDRSPNQ